MSNGVVHHGDGLHRTINLTALNDPRLSLKAVGLFAFLSTRSPKWSFSLAGLAETHTDGLSAVKSAIAELKECGYLEIVPKQDAEGRMDGYDWHVFPDPERVENRESDFPTVGESPTRVLQRNKSTTRKTTTDMSDEASDVFEELWSKHRRGSKKGAKRAFKKAANKVDLDTIRTAYLDYRSWVAARGDGFDGAHFQTWLNGERWDEVLEKPKDRYQGRTVL